MRDLTQCEVAAMWLYGAEYAKSGLSAMDWWKQLSNSRREVVRRMVAEITEALPTP